MPSSSNLIYRLLHKDYAESFSTYSPRTEDFYDPVHSRLPEGWSIQRKDIWFHCSPSFPAAPLQGWKIHVSSTLGQSPEVLEKVTSVLFKYADVAFKFSLDRSLLSLLNSKSWPRNASGKFITIYPPDSRRFIDLIEEIDQATAGMRGPYILSDRRYKNSRVVFYRYGGIRPHTALNSKGEKIPVLKGPDGAVIPDQRLAYPMTPAWETPILPVESGGDGKPEALTLLHGRYAIEKAVAFSNAGGVYHARDNRTGKKVVIKEARPCINATTDDYDAVDLLKKEHRLLTVVADTGIAPQPFDLFQEWEHWFLVEEFIDGTSMSHHSAASNVLLRTRATERDCHEWNAMFSRLCANLIKILKILHCRKIVFADLSPNNLIVSGSDQKLKIIDFEGAYQVGVDCPLNIYTPGFVSQHRIAGGQARAEDDYYSAGAVLLAYLLPINGLLHLNPQARQQFLASIRADIHLPECIADLINNLMDHADPSASETTAGVGVHEASPPSAYGWSMQCSSDYQAVVNDIARHLDGVAEYQRNDRLYPADPGVFATNPLSLAYGAAGVAYALYRVTGNVPQSAIEWILQHNITSTEYPSGLYIGMSGIAWSLLELGVREPAEEILQSTFKHPLAYSNADLFHGIAGWGMTGLRFFEATGNEVYLEQAKEAGKVLLESCNKSERGYYWTESGERSLGLAHGSSGISLFLLYLYLATENELYLAAGLRALDFDLAAGVRTKDGGLSWGKSIESFSPLYSYWRFGSAGIGTVTARFQRLLGSARYHSILEQIFIDTDRKYAVFPGRFAGLAGLGGFLLDMHDLTGEQRFLKSAKRVAEGIMHFRVERNGAAFPGELSSRLCCDYGTGSAGIALFLNRLLQKQKSDFMLDSLFERSPWARSGHGVSCEAPACGGAA
jgi:class III lanthionine synthetase